MKSKENPRSKKLVGSKITIVEDDGSEMVLQFGDTPMARAMGGLYAACESFDLSDCEALAMSNLLFGGVDRMCVVRKRGLPPLFRQGMKALISRGWVEETPKLYGLMETPETKIIINSAVQAVSFGESEGRA